MTDNRRKNAVWRLPERGIDWTHVQVALLMDIRDELMAQNERLAELVGLARCYRIPRALDGMYELGVEARRRKRAAAKKRKAAKQA